MNQQEDRDLVSDVIQFGQAALCRETFSSSDFTAPASSEASEPVFSKANVSMQAGFPELYREALVTNNRQVCHTNAI